jgi:predicted amidophosphoribosyltransferase
MKKQPIKEQLHALLDLVTPTSCAGCAAAGVPWCPSCQDELDAVRRVHRPAMATGPPVYALGEYSGAARRAVLAYKDGGRRDLVGPLAAALVSVLPWLPGALPDQGGTWWLVPVPSRRPAARRRGGAHMLRLVRQCAALLAADGQPAAVAPALCMARGVGDSVGLDAAGRAANLNGRVRIRPAGLPLVGTRVVLLDDVVTTGTTAATCTAALATAGIVVTAVAVLTSAGGR